MDYSRLSTWDAASGQPTWYDYAVGRADVNHDDANIYDAGKDGVRESDANDAEMIVDHETAWFDQLKELDRIFEAGDRDRSAAPSPSSNAQVKLEELPSSPAADKKPGKACFGYLFADENYMDTTPDLIDFNENRKNSRCEDWLINSTSSSPPSFEPLTPDPGHLAVKTEFVHEKQVSGPQYPAIFDTDEEYLSEHQGPLSHVEAGFGSVFPPGHRANLCIFRSDLDHHSPQHTQALEAAVQADHASTLVSGHYQEPLAQVNSYIGPSQPKHSANESRSILKPQSARRKLVKKILPGLVAESLYTSKQYTKFKKSIDNIHSKVSRKRSAQYSDSDSDDSSYSVDAYDSCKKKARLSANKKAEDDEIIPLSLNEQSSSEDQSSLRTISKDFFQRKPLRTPPKGYVGQFEGMRIDRVTKKAILPFELNETAPSSSKMSSAYAKTFGDMGHPNGIFTNTDFHGDELAGCPDLNERTAPPRHPIQRCMSFATDMTFSSCQPDMVALRSAEEETLRREGHIECASARLEGVAVGFWRYIEGVYGLEEYRQAGMCICWDECECNKMCTRFGDLKCPCSGNIVVHGD